MQFFALTQGTARVLSATFVVLLFFGTLMPGGWKEAGIRPFASVIDLAAASHVALFALIAFVLPRARFWTVRAWQVLALSVILAFATEGLQFFAVDRHPSVQGLGWDLLGTFIGWSLGWLVGEPSLRAQAG